MQKPKAPVLVLKAKIHLFMDDNRYKEDTSIVCNEKGLHSCERNISFSNLDISKSLIEKNGVRFKSTGKMSFLVHNENDYKVINFFNEIVRFSKALNDFYESRDLNPIQTPDAKNSLKIVGSRYNVKHSQTLTTDTLSTDERFRSSTKYLPYEKKIRTESNQMPPKKDIARSLFLTPEVKHDIQELDIMLEKNLTEKETNKPIEVIEEKSTPSETQDLIEKTVEKPTEKKTYSIRSQRKSWEFEKTVTEIPESKSTVTIAYSPSSPAKYCGLENMGLTCYLNACIQMLFNLAPFMDNFKDGLWTNAIENFNYSTGKSFSDTSLLSAFLELQKKVRCGGKFAERPAALKQAVDFCTSKFIGRKQHDAHEFLSCFLEELEKEFKMYAPHVKYSTAPSHESNGTKIPLKSFERMDCDDEVFLPTCNAFQSKIHNRLTCTNCHVSRGKEETFRDFSIDLPANEDNFAGQNVELELEMLLEQFFAPDFLSYICENCEEGTKLEKKPLFDVLPNVLIVHLKRFKKQESLRAKNITKLLSKVILPMDLDMSRFCMDTCRNMDNFSNSETNVNGRKCFNLNKSETEDTSISALDEIRKRKAEWEDDSTPKKQHVEKPEQKKNELRTKYTLSGVVHHVGKASVKGHYVTIIRENNGQWALYDDRNVEKISADVALGGEHKISCYIAAYTLTKN